MYGDDNCVLESFYDRIVEDFLLLSSKGIILSDGRPFWLIPLGIKGDWPFLETRQILYINCLTGFSSCKYGCV